MDDDFTDPEALMLKSALTASSAFTNAATVTPTSSIFSMLDSTLTVSSALANAAMVTPTSSIFSVLDSTLTAASAFTNATSVIPTNSIFSMLDSTLTVSSALPNATSVIPTNSIFSMLDSTLTVSSALANATSVIPTNSNFSVLDSTLTAASAFTNAAIVTPTSYNHLDSLSSELTTLCNVGLDSSYAPPLFSVPALGQKRRRFELLLPLQFNNGNDIPKKLIDDARKEIVDQFGGLSCEAAKVEGYWLNGATVVHDDLIRIWVDTPDLESSMAWMKNFKERWKRILRQDELWLVDFDVRLN